MDSEMYPGITLTDRLFFQEDKKKARRRDRLFNTYDVRLVLYSHFL